VYVDTGSDFVNGPKEKVVTRSGRDGGSIVRLRVEGVGARRVRIDPAGRRGLLRIDWLTIAFHLHNAVEPYKVTITSLDDLAGQQLALLGLRPLQANLLEIVGDDPQIIYSIDMASQPQLGGTYAIDVEMAFGWLGIRADPLQVRTGDAARSGLSTRAARKIRRELGGLR
jgi:hypothetical protein